MQSPTYLCLKERPAHIFIQSSARLSLLTSTCSVVYLLPQAYSNKLLTAALEAPPFDAILYLGAQRKGMVIFMDTISAVRNRILRLCAERNITISKLATLSALPPSSVKNILYGKSNDPKLLTIKKLCDGLEITLGEFFTTDEFDSLEPEIM